MFSQQFLNNKNSALWLKVRYTAKFINICKHSAKRKADSTTTMIP